MGARRLVCMAVLALTACAPAPRAADTGASSTGSAPLAKSLVVATTIEAPGFGEMFAGGTSGPEHLQAMLHRSLSQVNDIGDPMPEVALELPSPAAGTWRTFPDGRMETLWKVKPNVRWHDGTQSRAPRITTSPRPTSPALRPISRPIFPALTAAT